MNLFRTVGLAILLLQSVFSTAGTVLNVKRDFHAVGDSRTDDTKAFLAAVQKVNSLKHDVTLIIPAGNYSIKPQNALNELSHTIPSALEVLGLEGCTNVTIKGEKATKIKFAAGLYYGSFHIDGNNKLVSLPQITQDYQYRVAVGHGIKLTNCQNITISGIEIDGNSGGLILGGEFGDTGYQIDNDGILWRIQQT